jgi:site-specific DNA-cytosine methylase
MLHSMPQPAARLSARESGAHGARVRHAPHRATPSAAAARDGGVAYADAMKTSRWRKAFELLSEKKARPPGVRRVPQWSRVAHAVLSLTQLEPRTQVAGVSASEAAGLMRWPRSYVLVDVRRADQFRAYRATGAPGCGCWA